MRETNIDIIHGDKTGLWSSSDQATVNKMKELAAQYPNDIRVIHDYPFNDGADSGSYEIEIPSNWIRFPKPPKKRNLSDEDRIKLAERLKKSRGSRK